MSAANNKRAFDKDLRVGIKRENEKLALRADARAARELKKTARKPRKLIAKYYRLQKSRFFMSYFCDAVVTRHNNLVVRKHKWFKNGSLVFHEKEKGKKL